jgi:DNA-binding MarR family transcriptional regulator
MSIATAPVPDRSAGNGDDLDDLTARLRIGAMRLSRRLRQQSSGGLTLSQISALTGIDRHGPMTLGELSELERVSSPTITKLVAKLTGAGLITKETDPSDRRCWRVQATPEGRRLLTEIRESREAWLSQRLAALSDDERTRLAAAIDVIESLSAPEPGDGVRP